MNYFYRVCAIFYFVLWTSASLFALPIAIKSVDNSKYVHRQADGSYIANKTGIGSWGAFEQVATGVSGRYAFLAKNGKYLRVASDGKVVADASNYSNNDARFDLINSNGYWAYKSVYNGKYVSTNNTNGVWYANKTSITNKERYIHEYAYDIWAAMVAFPNNFPGKCKLPDPVVSSGRKRVTDERIINGNIHGWFVRMNDRTYDPEGEPLWDRNAMTMIGDWEVWACFGTYPYNYGGEYWEGGIPRTVRYFNPYIQQDSPSKVVQHWKVAGFGNCSLTKKQQATWWGRRYKAYMLDLSNPNSQVNMGKRWVVDVGLRDMEEYWTFDLGPSEGNFNPKYGLVRYVNIYGATNFTNIQDDWLIDEPHCGF